MLFWSEKKKQNCGLRAESWMAKSLDEKMTLAGYKYKRQKWHFVIQAVIIVTQKRGVLDFHTQNEITAYP